MNTGGCYSWTAGFRAIGNSLRSPTRNWTKKDVSHMYEVNENEPNGLEVGEALSTALN